MSQPADVVVVDGAMAMRGGPAADVQWWSLTTTVNAAALMLVRDRRLALDAPLPARPSNGHASQRDDLAAIGQNRNHDPRWVYHELLVGPLQEAAHLLNRLMTGKLLPPDLMSAMLHRHPVGGGPLDGRPWTSPGYGPGLMIGGVAGDAAMADHTGGTAAAFALGEDQGRVEARCVLSLTSSAAKNER